MSEERPEWFKKLVNRIWEDYQYYTGASSRTDEIEFQGTTVKKSTDDIQNYCFCRLGIRYGEW